MPSSYRLGLTRVVKALALLGSVAAGPVAFADTGAICNKHCDGRDPGQAVVDREAVSASIFGRYATLHIDDASGMGWASIEGGVEADEVWIDRSFDGGRSWTGNALLGDTKIPAGRTGWRTGMYNVDNWSSNTEGLLRVCGKAGNRPDIACSSWARSDHSGKAVKIMPLGDSITYGWGTDGGYRTDLFSDLRADGINVNFVGSQTDGPAGLADKNHEGHSGWRIANIAGSIDNWLNTSKPDVVALMIGTNDIVFNDDVGNAPARLSRLIDQITNKLPNAQVVVSSITPLADAGKNAQVQTYNAAIPGIVREKAAAGKHVRFVNMRSAISASDIGDGTHPTAHGYAKMAVVWRNALTPLLRGTDVSLPLNTTKSFQVTTPGFTDRYLRNQAGLGVTAVVSGNSADGDKQDASFKIVRGLANASCYSLQSVSAPNDYLRHSGGRVRKNTSDNSDLFKQDATWCARLGASGKGVSFESYNYPGNYIRHYNSELWLASGADLSSRDGSGLFFDDITWTLANPLAPNVATGGSAEARDNAVIAQLLTQYNPQSNGWTKGPTMDAIINIYERTRDPKYRAIIERSFDSGRGWRSGDANKLYYDDMGWYANAWLRAYDVTGDLKYINEAKAIFSDMTKAWDNTCGGGVYWNSDRKYKNAITNELFLLIASRLARRAPNGTGAGSYQDWALKEWDWFAKSGMINGKKLINDGLNLSTCKNNNEATWTYNQGVILGGLTELWRLTGQRGYLAHAEEIADATITGQTYANGVLREPCELSGDNGCTGDALIFKGMFPQGLARLYNADRGNKPQYGAFLRNNAEVLWNSSRNSSNALGVKWVGPVSMTGQSSQAAGALLFSEEALLNAGGESSD